jgi:uncharacterized protein (TIGR02996 family)
MDEAAFLRAIVADPDDDAVRLIYADWLDEHAGAARGAHDRAAFLRGQVELARTTRDTPARRGLAFRVREWLERDGKNWLGPLKKLVHDWHFHRGFPDKVVVSARTLKFHAARLFTSAPLRRLCVTGLRGSLAPLRYIPEENTLAGLDLCYNRISTTALEQLPTFPALRGLRTLGLMFNRIDDDGARLLREHPFFQGLSLIRCGANPIRASARQQLRRRLGERVSFVCERDDDHLYAIQDDYAFTAGFGADDTQLLFRTWEHSIRLATFDHEGNLLEIQRRDVSRKKGASLHQLDASRDEVRQTWMKERGFRSATIRVKRFRLDEREGISGFNWWQDAFNDPDHPQPEVRDLVGNWLRNGQFEWRFHGGDNCWLDGTGEVTDT